MKHFAAGVLLSLLFFGANSRLLPAEHTRRYALILSEPPASSHYRGMEALRSAPALSLRQRMRAAQIEIEHELARRNLRVTGAVQTVLNAVFVDAPESRVAELRALPGVKAVAPLHRFRLHLNRAVTLQNVPAAWNVLGGTGNAGAGIKIGIVDTGIDQSHPAFQDASLAPPSGFPICTQGLQQDLNCTGAFTNNKVIVARSYVAELASGVLNPDGVPRPDDISPRDHVGHGTALAMITAGETNTGPSGITITGIAPKAWLGSYKVFGSPGVNDFTGGDVLISAIEAALNDGMDVAVLSLGSTALSGPLDSGAACGQPSGTPCDPEALAAENAVQAGMLIVSSAGNDGDSGQNPPTLNTINSPATSPSVLAAGASTNSHEFVDGLRVSGSGVPSNLQFIEATFGNGPLPPAPLTAGIIDITKFDSTGLGCNGLPTNSVSGVFALINRGTCDFAVKVTNAQNAGAIGVIFVDNIAESPGSTAPGGLAGTLIPAAMITLSDGTSLRSYIGSHSGAQVTLGSSIVEVDAPVFNTVSSFSSRGPAINYLLKPEAVAVADPVYMATERYDSNGEMYDASGYTAASGTSFAAPMLAGAAALVKQKNPNFTPLELKSAVVNTATQDITDNGQQASALAAGNGKLDAGTAVVTTVTVKPSTISFGAIGHTTTLPNTQQLAIHYSGAAAPTLSLSISGNRPPALDRTTVQVQPGQDQTVNLTLSGSPTPGIYEGSIVIQGGSAAVRVPYAYVVGDGVPNDILPILGDGFDSPVGQPLPDGLGIKIIDRYGVGVPNLPVVFAAARGGGSTSNSDSKTDQNGIALSDATLGSLAGNQSFTGQAGGLSYRFTGVGRDVPTINNSGVVNAASFQTGPGIVPGSYISIFGFALSDTTQGAPAVPLPLAISQTSVSFVVPSANLSLPGRLLYADTGQINVQVPWELPAQASVQIRVNVGETSGQIYTAQVAQFAPAIYVTDQQTAAVLDDKFQPITSSNPALRGHAVQLFLNGLGAVDHTPPDGEPVPNTPLVRTTAPVTVTVGGRTASVEFNGLAPGFPGLNQVNFVVPPDAPTGLQSLVVSVGGVSSPAVNMPVQ